MTTEQQIEALTHTLNDVATRMHQLNSGLLQLLGEQHRRLDALETEIRDLKARERNGR